MNNYAVMPKDDYVAACNAIREKTGTFAVIKSGELVDKVNGVYNAGAVALLQSSKYMHPTVRGEILRIDDMVDVPHKVTVTRRNKNFFNGNLLVRTQTINGITVDNKGDNTFHLHGTATTSFTTSFAVTTIGVRIDPTKIYTIHAKLIAGTVSGMTAMHPFIGVWDTPNGAVNYSNCTINSSLAVGDVASTVWPNTVNAVKADAQYISRFWLFANGVQQGAKIDFTIQVWINESITNLGYTPYIENLDTVKVKKYGKNLFDTNSVNTIVGGGTQSFKRIENGFSFQKVLANSSASVAANMYLNAGTYFLTGTCQSSDGAKLGWSLTHKGSFIINAVNAGTVGHKVTISTAGDYTFHFYANYNSGASAIITFTNLQLEYASSGSDYVPYQAPVEVSETFDSATGTVTLIPETSDVTLECAYCRDIDKYIDGLNVAEVV